jgi:ubiquinone/menaquinone biosynthesis C-methylase UbiE
MTKNDKILNLGCGNSRLSEELSEEGYEDITNIDFSTKVINIMEEKCKPKFPKMSFKVMDALNMKEIQTGSFNTVIDKGTLDSVLCGDNSVPNAQKMIEEVYRILAPGGHYICISYGDPEHRKKHLETQQWGNLAVDKVPKPTTGASSANNADENDLKNFHYIYTMTKAK